MIDEAAIWSRALSKSEVQAAMAGDILSVTPKGKVSTTWANIKHRTLAN